MKKNKNWNPNRAWVYNSPAAVGAAIAAIFFALIIPMVLLQSTINSIEYIGNVDFSAVIIILFIMGAIFAAASVAEKINRSISEEILINIGKRFFHPSYGNPLHLKEGELIPKITIYTLLGRYKLRIYSSSVKPEVLADLSQVISDCLVGRVSRFAVTGKVEDIAGGYVDYYIEDVIKKHQHQNVISNEADYSPSATRLRIRDELYIDYKNVPNGSAIIAGRTRSGKTTAIILTWLIPLLMLGRDAFGSLITIIDPKNAELSTCHNVLSPTLNGNVEHIFQAIKEFNAKRIERQQILNRLSQASGCAMKWWEANMHPCILFIDEFVALQGLLPKKPTKDNPEYCIEELKSLIRQIATQGASAGCYLILSTAEASVGTGGLEAVVNNACGIRVLFKPSKNEAAYLWNSEDIEALHDRIYCPGDAWISIDDGLHNNVQFTRFPKPQIGEYQMLDEMLQRYYGD